MAWEAYSIWRGLDNRTITKRWLLTEDGADGAAFTAAMVSADALVAALDDITNATMQDYGVRYINDQYNVGLGDLTEQALINVWAQNPNDTTDELALTQVYVPAPIVGIFMGASGADYNVVDRTDAQLQAYINALATHAYVSDGEEIDIGTAVNGMQNGRRVTRKLPRP